MQTVTLDKTGKIYIPKRIRQQMKGNKYIVVSLPGEIILHEIKKYKTAREALADVAKNPLKAKTPAAKARQAALEAAYEAIIRDRQ